jgi:integrase
MPRRARGLSAAAVAKAKLRRGGKPNRIGDGAGLYLLVRSGTSAGDPLGKFWTFRWVIGGRMREAGLGPAAGPAAVPLKEARERAAEFRRMLRDGLDPIEQRRAAKAAAAAATAKSITFRQCAEEYIAGQRAGWKNAKHAKQWEATLKTYAYPVMGSLPVQAIDTGLVLKVLQPIWTTIPETASRLRQRIEAVLDAAAAKEQRDGANPARWKGHLQKLLPKSDKVKRVEHHPALPYAEVGAFVAELREQEGTAARALEFLILTAARTGEVIGARWGEFDMAAKLWTIPGERMKAGKLHRVPLSARAVEILCDMAKLAGKDAPPADAYVFPGGRPDLPLSNMSLAMLLRRMERTDFVVHGLRSTFRDWCAERTNYPREVCEAALAHAVGDKVEAAYMRSDLFDRRRRLMADWSTYCSTPTPKPATTGSVTSIAEGRARGRKA